MAYLIQVTGTSGTGKASLIPQLAEMIAKAGYTVENILEPGPLRSFIKQYRLRTDKNPWEEAALFTADRLINYEEKGIISRMKEKDLVFLSERSFADTLVYQGLLGGVDLGVILKQNARIPSPDLTLCLTVSGAEGYRRVQQRFSRGGEQPTPTEKPESIDLLAGYFRIAKDKFPQLNMEMIDTTNLNENQVIESCYEKVKRIIK